MKFETFLMIAAVVLSFMLLLSSGAMSQERDFTDDFISSSLAPTPVTGTMQPYDIYYPNAWVPLRHRGWGVFRPYGFHYQRYHYGGRVYSPHQGYIPARQLGYPY